MSGIVGFIGGVFELGFWLLARGLMKPAFLILIALSYDAYTTPRFSFSKFNRMLVGETWCCCQINSSEKINFQKVVSL